MANPTLLDMPIARDGNKNTIPTTDNGTTGLLSQQYGWQLINAIPPQQGGKAVKREDFNGALYLLSNLLFYLQKGWQFEWNPNQAYYAGCIVKDTDGGLYCANTDVSASSTHPKDDAVNWSRYNSYALRSHSYNVGDTSSLPNILAGYFLECTTAGTTGATTPVITTPTVGGTVTDGTVVWTIRKSASTQDLTQYLPLSGGEMVAGAKISQVTDASCLKINAGKASSDDETGITINGKNRSFASGHIRISSLDNNDLACEIVSSSTKLELLKYTSYSNNQYTRMDLGGSAIVAKSLGSNGYVKRASGETTQWGETTITTAGTTFVNLNISFATTNYVVVASRNDQNNDYTAVNAWPTSVGQIKLVTSNAGPIKWLAIGY